MSIQVCQGNLNHQKKETIGQLPFVHSDGHWAGIMKRHELTWHCTTTKQISVQMDIGQEEGIE